MVDVGDKEASAREAVASGLVRMSDETRSLILERALPKGDVLEVARVAGIMAAKKTSDLIPLCHPIGIDSVHVELQAHDEGISVIATVRTTQRTGVEMEALTAVSVAALTIYDMVKGTERGVSITDLLLLRKSGGRSGEWLRGP